MEVVDRLDIVVDAANIHMDRKPDELQYTDKSMDPLQLWMTSVVLVCSLLVLVATFGAFTYKNLLTYQGQDGNAVVRAYLQKMAIYNVLILSILYLTYVFFFDYSSANGRPEQCFQIGDHKLIVLLIVLGSFVVGLVRFLAVGFAHSEGYDFSGSKTHQGFSVHTNHIYKSFTSPYLKTALITLFLVLVFLYAPLPGNICDPVLNADFCLTSWLDKGSNHPLLWRLLPVFLMILLPWCSMATSGTEFYGSFDDTSQEGQHAYSIHLTIEK
jgi:hypothetical protein